MSANCLLEATWFPNTTVNHSSVRAIATYEATEASASVKISASVGIFASVIASVRFPN